MSSSALTILDLSELYSQHVVSIFPKREEKGAFYARTHVQNSVQAGFLGGNNQEIGFYLWAFKIKKNLSSFLFNALKAILGFT